MRSPPEPPGPSLLVIGAPIAPADVPGLCERVRRVAAAGAPGPVVCDVSALARADVLTVHALARLQLTARRLGTRIVLHDAAPALRDLLRFAGLDAVVASGAGLGVEPEGQPEQREHPRGVEERVQPRDPAA
jgi:anti-anti-sigma regulatory factor